MTAPGLRIHSRTLPVQGAEADLGMFLSKLAGERELTPAEMVWIKVPGAAVAR